MEKTQLLSYPRLEVYFHPKPKIIELVWNGYVEVNDYIAWLEDVFVHIQQLGAIGLLTDHRMRKVIKPEASKWLAESYYPRLLAYRPSFRTGVLEAADIFAKMVADRFVKEADERYASSVSIRIFSHYDEAVSWLSDKNSSPIP